MRAEQIDASMYRNWMYSAFMYSCSEEEHRFMNDEMLAVPQSPGRARHFRPYPSSRRYRRR